MNKIIYAVLAAMIVLSASAFKFNAKNLAEMESQMETETKGYRYLSFGITPACLYYCENMCAETPDFDCVSICDEWPKDFCSTGRECKNDYYQDCQHPYAV